MSSCSPESQSGDRGLPPRVLIVAGEASGDAAGAALARELQQAHGFRTYGVGGPRMRAAGAMLLFDSSTWSCLGLSESLRMVPRMLGTFNCLKRLLAEDPPDVLVPIDFGAFNVPLSRQALKRDTPVLYFMPPRSWDCDPRRRHSVARAATKIATPFPWSAELLRRDGGDAEFVGHPLVDFCASGAGREEARTNLGLEPHRAIVGLLPGSRLQEMRYVLPICLAAAREIRARRPDVQLVLGPAPNIPRQVVERQLRRLKIDIPLVQHVSPLKNSARAQRTLAATTHGRLPRRESGASRVSQRADMAYDIMAAADALIVASGTATLEAACFGTPMVVVYDGPATGRLEFKLTRRVRHVSLPNIIGGRAIVPELLGRAVATPQRVADLIDQLLEDEGVRGPMLRGLEEVRENLGPSGAVRRTAELVAELTQKPRRPAAVEESTPSPS